MSGLPSRNVGEQSRGSSTSERGKSKEHKLSFRFGNKGGSRNQTKLLPRMDKPYSISVGSGEWEFPTLSCPKGLVVVVGRDFWNEIRGVTT